MYTLEVAYFVLLLLLYSALSGLAAGQLRDVRPAGVVSAAQLPGLTLQR